MAGGEDAYFQITVVDEQTGRGVPLVELKTTNEIRYYSDSNGVVAFREPGLMDQKVFFHVASDGYEYPQDGFGYRGKALDVVPGGKATLRIHRLNIAQRLYRVTGAGIYRDSVLVGREVPIRQPLLNGRVFGSDSVLTTVYRGKVYWFWGDTNRPAYPLGNFHVPGATSLLPGAGGLDPDVGVDLEYFLGPRGFAKETARMPGKGPTWLGGLVTLGDEPGRQRMYASYVKVEPPLRVYERGLVAFDDGRQQFVKLAQFPDDAPLVPGGHTFQATEGDARYVYFTTSIPPIRVRAREEDLRDPKRYEAFTCLKPGSRKDSPVLDRDEKGQLRYAWKADTAPLTRPIQQQLIQAGKLKLDETLVHLQEADTGTRFIPHGHSVYWNEHRKRWVMIVLESFGSPSPLGEVWYAEADTPIGPWVYARKVVTHKKYSFYNPKQHPMFDKEGGRIIFFEGTYSTFLTDIQTPTPRYNYNQIMYKLDLDDPRLVLPVPVYRWTDRHGTIRLATRKDLAPGQSPTEIAFFALDRRKPGAVPLFGGSGSRDSVQPSFPSSADSPAGAGGEPLFYALPAEVKDPPKTIVALYRYVRPEDGRQTYGLADAPGLAGYERSERPVGRVWANPLKVEIRWSAPRPARVP